MGKGDNKNHSKKKTKQKTINNRNRNRKVKMVVKRSDKKQKKFKAIFTMKDGRKRTTHFGARGMSDYTIHKVKERRLRYRKRHKKDLDTRDYTRAGFLSYYILWGDKTNVKDAVKDYRKRFNLD